MLLNRRSLSASDRVELEVRAIAGVADRVGVALSDAELSGLLGLADGAGRSAVREQTFRNELARQHLSFEKRLWASDESRGKAYELGNFLSDSWNRMLRPQAGGDPHDELRDVFAAVRIERMKHLLDDLQARIDPVAAHTVSNHLDQWHARVSGAPEPQPDPQPMTVDEVAAEFEPLERQTIIWRQLLTGDKEPESWIGHARRVEVRDELTKQLWRRYRRPLPWLVPLVLVVGIGLYLLYEHNKDTAKEARRGPARRARRARDHPRDDDRHRPPRPAELGRSHVEPLAGRRHLPRDVRRRRSAGARRHAQRARARGPALALISARTRSRPSRPPRATRGPRARTRMRRRPAARS